LAIGAAHGTKRLPTHKLLELCQAVEGPIVLIGGPEDLPVARQLASSIGGRLYNAAGRHDILGSAALIRGAQRVFAHDSGAMHIAAAFGKPLVSIWGSTVPAFGMSPYMPEHPERAHIAEVPGLACRPCSKIGFDRCPKGHFHCMELHDIPTLARMGLQHTAATSGHGSQV
jgi:ADP-heptose:LPS heptosyltransferase